MKLFIFILILACFIQSAFLPLNIVLILLISRSLIFPQRSNLILAFVCGVLLGLLTSVNIGFYALLFVLMVEGVHLLRKSPLSANILTIVPLTFFLISLLSLIEQVVFGSLIHLSLLFIQAFLALPLFLLVRFWEERFVVQAPLKLRM